MLRFYCLTNEGKERKRKRKVIKVCTDMICARTTQTSAIYRSVVEFQVSYSVVYMH